MKTSLLVLPGLVASGCASTVAGSRTDAGAREASADIVLRDGCEARPFRPVDPNIRPEPTVDNTACTTAPSLDPASSTPHVIELAGNRLLARGCASGRALIAPVALRRIRVPARTTLEVEGDGLQIGLHLGPCALATCIAAALPNTLDDVLVRRVWTNGQSTDADVVLSVSSPNPITRPLVRAEVRTRLTRAAPGDACATAAPLAPGAVVLNHELPQRAEAAPGCVDGSALPARWYRTRVEPGATLAVSAIHGSPSATTFVRLYDGCGGPCLTEARGSFSTATATATWSNPAPSARDVVVAVSSSTAWSLSVSNVTPAPNGQCAAARAVSEREPARGASLLGAGEAPPRCPLSSPSVPVSGALYYTVDVPPNSALFAQARSTVSYAQTAGYATTVQVFDGCGGACLAEGNGAPVGGSTSWVNRGTSTQRVVVALGTRSQPPPAPLDLSVRVAPVDGVVGCATAASLNACTTFLDQQPATLRDVPTCGVPLAAAAAQFYRARVLPGERLRIRSYPTLGRAPTVYGFDDCTTRACIGRWGAVSDGNDLGYFWFMNRTGAPRDLVVVVVGSGSRFDLDVDFAPPPFDVSRVPLRCDDMTGAEVLSITADQPGSLQRDLPITFRYVGQNLRAWSASRFGYLQVWRAEGSSLLRHTLAELPESSAPANAIAPFWDDALRLGERSAVRWRVVTEGGARRLTVEWSRVEHGASDAPLTFQAKLFEGSNALEYHYCTVGSSPDARGGSAVVGLQDDTGDVGVTWAFRRPDAVTSGTALRLTPTR